MASFKERFREKSSVVGKDGQNAMLSPALAASPLIPPGGGGGRNQTIAPPPPEQQSAWGQTPQAIVFTNKPAPTTQWAAPPSVAQNKPPVGFGVAATFQPPPPLANATPQTQQPQREQVSSKAPVGFGVPATTHQPVAKNQPPATTIQQRGPPVGFGGAIYQAPSVGSSEQVQQAPQRTFGLPVGFQPTGILPGATSAPQPSPAPAPVQKGNAVLRPPRQQQQDVKPSQAPANQSRRGVDDVVPQQDEHRASPGPRRGNNNAVKFGRRAGSSDGNGNANNADDARYARLSSDVRPNTDPSGSSKETERREIHYVPYKITDYNRMKEELQKKTSGGLGPSDTDETRAAAIRTQRLKEYAEGVKRVNKAILVAPQPSGSSFALDGVDVPSPSRAARPIVQPVPQEVIEKQQRRERAVEYAKRVPKPKVKPAEESKLDAAAAAPDLWGGEDQGKVDRERHIADLEAKHASDQQMVANLKKQLRI